MNDHDDCPVYRQLKLVEVSQKKKKKKKQNKTPKELASESKPCSIYMYAAQLELRQSDNFPLRLLLRNPFFRYTFINSSMTKPIHFTNFLQLIHDFAYFVHEFGHSGPS